MNYKTPSTLRSIPPIMTRKDLQNILQISKNTALELLQTEKIDSFQIKGRYRITQESLIRFIEESTYFNKTGY
ncbi:MAG: helix-turn-helix domain-containing protein [Lachnospiraceae bacterium]|nr:helix-turn-helix domain-containing protein [Lachnospiraceae bacterium]